MPHYVWITCCSKLQMTCRAERGFEIRFEVLGGDTSSTAKRSPFPKGKAKKDGGAVFFYPSREAWHGIAPKERM